MSDTATTPTGAVAEPTPGATDGSADTSTLISGAPGVDSATAATPTDNPFSTLINADGSFRDGWVNDLAGDDYADLRATAANYKTLPALLRSLKESKSAAMQRLDGMAKIPGADATEEDRAAWRKAIGVPETADGYEIPPDAVPQGVELDPEAVNSFKALAHEQALTPGQAAALVKFQAELESRALAEQQQEAETYLAAQRQELQNEWGAEMQKNLTLVHRTAATFGLEPENPIFQSAAVVKAFARIGAAISEDRLVSGESLANKLSPEAMADDIMQNDANPLFRAYHNPDDPQHAHAVAEFQRLMKKAFPG